MTRKIPWRYTSLSNHVCCARVSCFPFWTRTTTLEQIMQPSAAILRFSLALWTVMITAATLQAGGFDSWRRKVVGNELNAPIENVIDKLEQRNWRSYWKYKVCMWVQRTSMMLNAENLTGRLLVVSRIQKDWYIWYVADLLTDHAGKVLLRDMSIFVADLLTNRAGKVLLRFMCVYPVADLLTGRARKVLLGFMCEHHRQSKFKQILWRLWSERKQI